MEVYPEKMDGVLSIFSGYTSIYWKFFTVIP